MVARRISLEEAIGISGINIRRFDEFYDGRVPIRAGLYYAIVASSSAVGVAYCEDSQPGFVRADNNYNIGFAGGEGSAIACFVDMDTLKK